VSRSGGQAVSVTIGGLRYLLRTEGPFDWCDASPDYARFCQKSNDDNVDTCFVARYGACPPSPTAPPDFAAEPIWRLFRSTTEIRFELSTPKFRFNPFLVGVGNVDLSRADVVIDDRNFEARPFPLKSPFDELWTIEQLATRRGLLLHGCGVLVNGIAHVFLGRSGAGKSTIARLFRQHAGWEVLSDDRLILRAEPGGTFVYGTPWHGEAGFASPGRGRLGTISTIRHAASNRLERPGAGEAVLLALEASFPAVWSRQAVEATFDLVQTTLERYPMNVLGFVPDPSTVNFVARELLTA
jgi:hypothetical protein